MEDIIKILAKRYSLPKRTVEQIIKSPFKVVKDVISGYKGEGEIPCIHIPYFGKFYMPDYYKKKFIKD